MPPQNTLPSSPEARDVTAPNAALLYHPDSFQVKRHELKGRHVASASFLKGFVRHGGTDSVLAAIGDPSFREAFSEAVAEYWPGTSADPMPRADTVSVTDHARLASIGTLMCADPMLAPFAARRTSVGNRAYSLCGITHTISSKGVQAGLAAYLTAPLQPWDALICTSRAVRDAVRGMQERYAEKLEAASGTRPKQVTRLATIPLGLEADFYAAQGSDSQARAAMRSRLGVAEDDIVLLFLGRLAFHAKAHPYPMYVAVQRAQEKLKAHGRRLHLLLTGQFANNHVEPDFRASAAEACPDVPVHFQDGTPGPESWASWAAADIFISLSDNIQESFGITPIEAMAAGLPCIVSDWDGYKDTTPDQEVGFRVPTRMAPPGSAVGLAEAYENDTLSYDRFVGTACLMTEVDVASAAEAVYRLAASPEMRRRMGAAGQARARTVYDWSVIVPRYQELWAELAEIRASAAEYVPVPARPTPVVEDPMMVFAGYASDRIDGATRVTAVQGRDVVQRLLANNINNFTPGLVFDPANACALHDRIAAGTVALSDLAKTVPANIRQKLVRTVIWMAKFGAVSLSR